MTCHPEDGHIFNHTNLKFLIWTLSKRGACPDYRQIFFLLSAKDTKFTKKSNDFNVKTSCSSWFLDFSKSTCFIIQR